MKSEFNSYVIKGKTYKHRWDLHDYGWTYVRLMDGYVIHNVKNDDPRLVAAKAIGEETFVYRINKK